MAGGYGIGDAYDMSYDDVDSNCSVQNTYHMRIYSVIEGVEL